MFNQVVGMAMMARMARTVMSTVFLQTPAKIQWVNKNLPEAGDIFKKVGGIQKGSFLDTLRIERGPVDMLIRPTTPTAKTRVFVWYRGKVRETTAELERLPLSRIAGTDSLYHIEPVKGQRVWVMTYDSLWGGSWTKVDVITNVSDLVSPMEEAVKSAKAAKPRFGGKGGRGKGQPMIDTEYKNVYHSKTEVGKRLAKFAKSDPKSQYAWYDVNRAFPGRFREATETEIAQAKANGVYFQTVE